ncbi:MAG: DUF4397 domain-containing protein [Gemmatimonadaceae bacterium]
MRRFIPLSALCIAAGIVSACTPDATIPTTTPPTAGVRFINAVPDTAGAFGMDFHFVDVVENNENFRISFRNSPAASGIAVATTIEYKPAQAGSRHFAIFFDDTIQSIASTKLADTTVTLVAGHNYSAILWGNARSTGSDKMHLTFIDETVADPGAQIALRVVNATNAPIDASQYAQGGTAPASASWSNVQPYSASTYITAAPGNIMYNVKAAGTATNMFADLQAPPGAVAFSSAGAGGKIDEIAVPGTAVAGSAITLFVFPRSAAGSRTPQTAAFIIPAGAFAWDRRPPNPPGV